MCSIKENQFCIEPNVQPRMSQKECIPIYSQIHQRSRSMAAAPRHGDQATTRTGRFMDIHSTSAVVDLRSIQDHEPGGQNLTRRHLQLSKGRSRAAQNDPLSVSGLRGARADQREREGGGSVIDVPGRILATLQRKFWDSNKVWFPTHPYYSTWDGPTLLSHLQRHRTRDGNLDSFYMRIVSDRAVWARDLLAGAYMASKDKAGEVAGATVHNTLQVYKFARDQSTTIDLPGPLKPVRDHVLIPSFRGVERSVDFLLSPRLGQAYLHLKEQGANLPLVGRAIFLPSVEAAEGATKLILVMVQAPLPSAEKVANVAEVSMDLGKRGLSIAFREVYFYMDLIDQQVTRTMTRAQWDILGYGPYAHLPRERREEVVDRTCEKYLSLEHPIQRYEFLAHIRWHNAALHDDLVQSGTLRDRANAVITTGAALSKEEGSSQPSCASCSSPSPSPFAGDAWLDPAAMWRSTARQKRGCIDGVVLEGVSTTGARVAWFWRSGGVWETELRDLDTGAVGGDMGNRGPWKPFSNPETRRLERSFVAAEISVCGENRRPEETLRIPRGQREGRASTLSDLSGGVAGGTSSRGGGDGGRGRSNVGDKQGLDADSPGVGEKPTRVMNSVTYQPTAGVTISVRSYEVQPNDVLVDQGRHAVSISEMLMRPVYWPFSGQGDDVCRAVWLQDTGSQPRPQSEERDTGQATGGMGEVAEEALGAGEGFMPYPLRAAAILEDAYQFLAWYLGGRGTASCQSGDWAEEKTREPEGSKESPTVLLTVQVADQLVQFRSLTDIVSVKRTLGGAFSVFGRRRVFRGLPVAESAPSGSDGGQNSSARAHSASHPMEASTSTGSDEVGVTRIDGNVDGGVDGAHPCGTTASADTGDRAINADFICTTSEAIPRDSDGTNSESYSNLVDTDAEERSAGMPVRANETPETGYLTPPRGAHKADVNTLKSTSDENGTREGGSIRSDLAREVVAVDIVEEDLHKEEETVGGTPRNVASGLGKELDPGADDADLNERVEHLVLVVHGIGDALMSVDLGVVQLQSLVECCDTMRDHHEEVVLNSKHLRGFRKGTHQQREGGEKRKQDNGGGRGGRGMGRVEYLPIEWHTRFKGRLYKESGAGAKTRNDAAATLSVSQTPDPDAAFVPAGASTAACGHTEAGSWDGADGGNIGEAVVKTSGGVLSRSMSSGSRLELNMIGEAGAREERDIPAGIGGGDGARGVGGGLSIWDITLPRAPTLRAFTNDTLLDILYFMSPEYHQVIVEEVTQEMNRVVALYRKHCRSWSGKVSIAAHSLGAIICFDIMANQQAAAAADHASPADGRMFGSGESIGEAAGIDVTTSAKNSGEGDVKGRGDRGGARGLPFPEGERDPCPQHFLGSTKFPALSTRVENVFCLGSPIGMFLMIRGQHRGLGKTFRLPGCRRLFNIFHPYDPVAFRLEPLLRGGRGDEALVTPQEPVILPTWTGGLRVHYQVQRWWHDIWTRIWEAKQQVESSIERSLESVGLIDERHQNEESQERLFSATFELSLENVRELREEGSAAACAAKMALDDGNSQTSGAPTTKEDIDAMFAVTGACEPLATLVTENADAGQSKNQRDNQQSATSDAAAAYAHPNAVWKQPASPLANPQRNHEERKQTGTQAYKAPGDTRTIATTGKSRKDSGPGVGESEGLPARPSMPSLWESSVMEEDLERNGALAGGRRVDYCLQEKEFEVTNEYIFALGSHVIYWSSKDVSLFVAQQVVEDAIDEDVGAG